MRKLAGKLSLLRYLNWAMVLAVAGLVTMGILFVYSACFVDDDVPARSQFRRQIMWAVIGTLCYFGFAASDYRALRRASWWLYGAAIALLVAVLLVGRTVYGAQRWLVLFGVGIQPAEFAKLAVIVVLARKLSRPGVYYGEWRHLLAVFAVFAVPFALIAKQPDLGTAMILAPVTFLLMFAGGVPFRVIGSLLAVALVGAGTVLGAILLPEKLGASPATQSRVAHMVGISDYQKKRVMVYLGANVDPLGAGWNKLQSEIAVGSGGVWGKGYLKGTQNVLGFLPRTVSPTDFIYSVVAEESGFAGSVLVVGLFGVVVLCCMWTAMLSRDKMGRLLCVGVAAMLFSHATINIGMTIGLLPITGVPLPLLSYGGTFMVVCMSALGIVQSVHIRARHAFVE